MYMVALDCELNNLPIMLICNFLDELLKSPSNWTMEYLPPHSRAPDDMIHNQVDCVVIMNVFHVYGIPAIDTSVNPTSTGLFKRLLNSPNIQETPLRLRLIWCIIWEVRTLTIRVLKMRRR